MGRELRKRLYWKEAANLVGGVLGHTTRCVCISNQNSDGYYE
jgi:hypothetical protein